MKLGMAKSAVMNVTLFVVAFALASRSFAAIDPKTLVGAWLFDEGSGNAAKDSSGKNLNGTFTGAPKWVAGKFGSALEFDGKTNYVSTAEHENPTDAITVSLWVKSPTATWSQHGFMIEKRDAYIMHPIQGGVNVAWCFCNGGCWNQPKTWDTNATGPKDITAWHMYTGTFDSKTGDWNLYIDGENVGTMQINKTKINAVKGPAHIGYDGCCGGRFGAAAIDETLVFNVALSKEDVKTLFGGYAKAVVAVEPAGKLPTYWAKVKTE